MFIHVLFSNFSSLSEVLLSDLIEFDYVMLPEFIVFNDLFSNSFFVSQVMLCSQILLLFYLAQ